MVKNSPAKYETWIQSLGSEDPLEKEMATYSSILAWRIPWTEEPGMLQSMGSQRVGHNLGTKQNTKTRQALLNRCPGKFKFCFLELSGIFFLVFLIHSWLTLQMQNTQIWRVDCVCVCVCMCVCDGSVKFTEPPLVPRVFIRPCFGIPSN